MSMKPKAERLWVAVDPSGWPGPWTARRTRRDCKIALINEWLGADIYEKCGKDYRIVRATLTVDPPKKRRTGK